MKPNEIPADMTNPHDVGLMFDCPRCAYPVDAASSADGAPVRPRPDDISVCIACGCPMQFDIHRKPRWLTMEEIRRLGPVAAVNLMALVINIVTLRPSRITFIPIPPAAPEAPEAPK